MKRWEEIDTLLSQAVGMPRDRVGAFLDERCGEDLELRETVERMLSVADDPEQGLQPGGALGGPLGQEFLRSMAGLDSKDVPPELSHYELQEMVGAGGMGMVYRALDRTLGRRVAIKIIRPDARINDQARERFRREAKAASALNHPGIVTVHELSRADSSGRELDFMVMEYVDGTGFDELVPDGGLSLDEVVDYAEQIASALAAAHAVGIVHRDLKPSNILLTKEKRVKVLDFGIAKLLAEPVVSPSPDQESGQFQPPDETIQGVVLGTAPYMSPEQSRGETVDARSDVFSFGTLLYEMLSGARAFPKATRLESAVATLRDDEPAPLPESHPPVPVELKRVLERCLQKQPDARYPSAVEVLDDIRSVRARLSTRESRKLRLGMAALVVVSLAIASLVYMRDRRKQWIQREAIPQAEQLISERRLLEASVLLGEVRADGEDPVVAQLYNQATRPMTILSDPPGAEVYIRDYARQDQEWLYLTTTPAQDLRIPAGHLRFKLDKEGYAPIERALDTWVGGSMQFRLWPSSEAPPNMVYVDGIDARLARGETVRVSGFWLDRFEVSNSDFQDFVDAGGYERSGLWKEPMIRHGAEVSWDTAMTVFVDKTGRPGPGTWELGRFPEGYGDHPVGGVSWYEAAAYAEFVGKKLPSFHHWHAAAGFDRVFSDILFLSNLGSRASAAPVGAHDGLGPFGTYDMAGNVKEWSLNPSGSKRLLLGGAWAEPLYAYTQEDARDPFERLETHGFRCALYEGDLDPSLLGDFALELADFRQVDAVSDQDFAHFMRLYEYDRTPLDAIVEERDESSRFFIKETIHIATAYGDERLPVRLYLPRDIEPPYHAVVYYPGVDARMSSSSLESQGLSFVDFLPRSGRALVWPIYKGHYERGGGVPTAGPVALRELYVATGKDYRRVLDYLETRDDIDSEKMGFMGLSLGGSFGAVLSAIDERPRANVWVAAGADVGPVLPEIEPFNFAPRVKTPTILINGSYDFVDPVETSQRPFFEALGIPSAHRRLHLSDSGHLPPQDTIVRETLAWFDRYLGPVQRRSPPD